MIVANLFGHLAHDIDIFCMSAQVTWKDKGHGAGNFHSNRVIYFLAEIGKELADILRIGFFH